MLSLDIYELGERFEVCVVVKFDSMRLIGYVPPLPNTKIDGETALAWQIPATAAADIETTHKMCLELRSEEEKERCPF